MIIEKTMTTLKESFMQWIDLQKGMIMTCSVLVNRMVNSVVILSKPTARLALLKPK